jgi:hypothetical protein
MTVTASLSDKLVVAAVTFVLTGILGAIWTFLLSRFAWKRQSRQTLHQQRYDEGVAFLDTLSKLIGKRFFLLQRLVWTLRDNEPEHIAAIEEKYFRAVSEWNFVYWANRNKIRLLVGDSQAESFLSYDDDQHPDNPTSLHYAFARAHRLVMAAKANASELTVAEQSVAELNWKCSIFLERLTTDFLVRATSLSLLKVPKSHLPDEREKVKIRNHARTAAN